MTLQLHNPYPPPTPMQWWGMFLIGVALGRLAIHFAQLYDRSVADAVTLPRRGSKVSWTARLG
jgi:hypothetical protein